MRKEATFMALGGAQRVGGSCYFLRFGKANILLDAGGSIHRGMASGLRFNELLGSPYLESMKQITHIFISHAHNDHVAALINPRRRTVSDYKAGKQQRINVICPRLSE